MGSLVLEKAFEGGKDRLWDVVGWCYVNCHMEQLKFGYGC